MDQGQCIEDECEAKAKIKNRCEKHYYAVRHQRLKADGLVPKRIVHTGTKCSVPKCWNPVSNFTNVLCRMHQTRLERNGTLESLRPRGTPIERLLGRIEINDEGCWIYTGAKNLGYGAINAGSNRAYPTHRLAYEFWIGPIGAGMQIDHSCHDPRWCIGGDECPHRACCNPDHLVAVTPKKNSQPERRRSGVITDAEDTAGDVQRMLHVLTHSRPFVMAVVERINRGEEGPRALIVEMKRFLLE